VSGQNGNGNRNRNGNSHKSCITQHKQQVNHQHRMRLPDRQDGTSGGKRRSDSRRTVLKSYRARGASASGMAHTSKGKREQHNTRRNEWRKKY